MFILSRVLLLFVLTNRFIFIQCHWSLGKIFTGGCILNNSTKTNHENLRGVYNPRLYSFNDYEEEEEINKNFLYRNEIEQKLLTRVMKTGEQLQYDVIPIRYDDCLLAAFQPKKKIMNSFLQKHKKLHYRNKNINKKLMFKNHKRKETQSISDNFSKFKDAQKDRMIGDKNDENNNILNYRMLINTLNKIHRNNALKRIPKYLNDADDSDDDVVSKTQAKQIRNKIKFHNLSKNIKRRSRKNPFHSAIKKFKQLAIINKTFEVSTDNALNVNGSMEGIFVMDINFSDSGKSNDKNTENIEHKNLKKLKNFELNDHKNKTSYIIKKKIISSKNVNNDAISSVAYELFEVNKLLTKKP